MARARRIPGQTRERLLETACRLFAEKGYRGTSVAQICSLAKANIAAVNYYFGGKEGIYQQAWRRAHGQLLSQVPPDDGVGAARPAAERLRGRIRAGLRRALLGDALEFCIMRNEMANPTGLLREVIDDAIRPIREATQQLLRELLGPGAGPLDVELCEVAVVAPLMHITHRSQATKHEGLAPVFTEDMLDEMTDHFTAYALAGIRTTRRRIERKAVSHERTRGTGRRKAVRQS